MTAPVPEMTGPAGPWQRYVAREHAARDLYIEITREAHRQYLAGPWPDRDAYQHVEQSAWVTYYAAGRQAWIDYAAELTPPPPPPARVTPSPIAQREANAYADDHHIARPYPVFIERNERLQ